MKKIILFLLTISIVCAGEIIDPVYYLRYENGIGLVHQDGSFDYGVDTFGGIFYNPDGSVKNASGKKISYNENGSVKRIGSAKITYYNDGRLKNAGGSTLFYNKDGKVTRIGSSRITYNSDGKVKNASHGLAGLKKSFDPILAYEIKDKLVVYINKAGETAFGIVSGGSVFYNKEGRIKSVGSGKIFFNNDNKIKSISGTTIFYDNDGKVKNIGGKRLSRDETGRVKRIGGAKITYDKEGRVTRTGTGVIAVFKNRTEIKPKEEIPPLPSDIGKVKANKEKEK